MSAPADGAGAGKRKLAAILSADAVGYTRLMQADDAATVATLKEYRTAIGRIVQRHSGRVVNAPGDALLAEFGSALEAVRAAVEIQQNIEARNHELATDRQMHFRLGVDLGDVIEETDGTIYGDGVNIAARLEALADAGGICVSGAVFDQIEGKLRLTFESLGEQQVKNIAKPVRVYRLRTDAPRPAKATPLVKAGRWRHWAQLGAGAVLTIALVGLGMRLNRDLGQKPPSAEAPRAVDANSIAVLPFGNMSGDPEQEYFADGLTEDITSGLARVRELFVIARNSSFIYKGKPVDVREVGRALGVRYVLEGSVRKDGEQVRITAQLIDAGSGGHVWSERYDRPLADIFALQDEVTREVVAALRVEINQNQSTSALGRTANMAAYDLLLRARAYVREPSQETNALARKLLEKAIELDPGFADAHAELSFLHFRDWFFGWTRAPLALDQAVAMAQRAVALEDRSALAHARLAWVLSWAKRWDEAVSEGERAVALDPNSADAQSMLARALDFAGRYQDALAPAQKAWRLDPEYYLSFHTLGTIQYRIENHGEALAMLKAALARYPEFMPSHMILAATYVEIAKIDAARAEIRELLRLSPSTTIARLRERLPYRDSAGRDRMLDAFAKAGLPAGAPEG